MLRVHSIETLGTQEGPGIRLLIFLQGCNIRCLYCHNPDALIIGEGKEYSTDKLVNMAIKQKPYFGKNGGVTASGGEPLVQREGLTELFIELKKNMIKTAIETNATILDEKTKELLSYTDILLLDLKHIDQVWMKRLTGFASDMPLKMADYREKTKKEFWLRYVLVPGFTDQEEFLEKTAKHFKKYKYLKRVEILPYHTLGIEKYHKLGWEYKLNVKPPTDVEKNKAKKIFEKYLKNVFVR
ncbi:MAG: pyruvate formate-lyase-activating protein [archaeon]